MIIVDTAFGLYENGRTTNTNDLIDRRTQTAFCENMQTRFGIMHEYSFK